MQHKFTQAGIAEALGLSLKTVQRSFADSGKVADSTRHQVHAFAAEVGYAPNRVAQALVSKTTRTIRLFSSAWPGYFWDKVARGAAIAHGQIDSYGYRAVHHRIDPRNTAAYVRELIDALDEGMDAAAIVNNPEYDMGRIFGFLDHHEIPYITLNIDAPESGRLCCVKTDFGQGGRMAAEFMGKIIREEGRVLIIHNPINAGHVLAGSHINEERLLQFVAYLSIHFPRIEHQVMSFRPAKEPGREYDEIEDALAELLLDSGEEFHGIYSIAAVEDILANLMLTHSLESRLSVLVHEITPRTEIYLRSHVFSAAIHQNPLQQGYLAVRVLEHYLATGQLPSRPPVISQGLVVGSNVEEEENFFLVSEV